MRTESPNFRKAGFGRSDRRALRDVLLANLATRRLSVKAARIRSREPEFAS